MTQCPNVFVSWAASPVPAPGTTLEEEGLGQPHKDLPKSHRPKGAHIAGCSPPEQRMAREWVCVKVWMDTLSVEWDKRRAVKRMGASCDYGQSFF